MTVKEMEARLKALEKKVGILDDINEVKRLQRAYSYYVQHMMRDEIYDCFADSPEVSLHWLEGTWLGKEGVKRYFGVGSDRPEPPPGFLHQVMPIAGVVEVTPDGKRAKGRWYSFGAVSMPAEKGKFRSSFVGGIYEIEYIKQNGVWKFLKVDWIIPFNATIAEGAFIPPEKIGESIMNFKAPGPDIKPTASDPRFKSGYIFPFHYNHPVTGKATSEKAKNARLLGAKKAKDEPVAKAKAKARSKK
jgi:hypothetical protein